MIGRTLPRENMLVAGQHAWCWREKSTVQALLLHAGYWVWLHRRRPALPSLHHVSRTRA